MISIEDAMRATADELDRIITIQIDRYRITLEGERDPDVEKKVQAYAQQLAAFRDEKLAETERELEQFCRDTRSIN